MKPKEKKILKDAVMKLFTYVKYSEPLDGDETIKLADYFLTELDYQMGNITEVEYNILMDQY